MITTGIRRVLGAGVAPGICVLLTASAASAAPVVIDSFDVDEGHFTQAPSFSGTTTGETETAPGVGPSTADRVTDEAFAGAGSQRIFLDDNPNANVPGEVEAWRLRHLSGGGTIANNVALTASGYVGYYLKTSTPNLQASIMLDDGSTGHLERAVRVPITADNQWHLYQWNIDDDAQWDAFAGTGANGTIESATATIDSIFIDAVRTSGDQDAVFFIDSVSHDPNGPLPPVPEPMAAGVIAVGAVGALARRRRI